MSNKRMKTYATKRISPKKSLYVACTPSKTKTARKQLKMTTITPNWGGDMAITAAPLVDTSILDANVASDGFGDITVVPSTSASDSMRLLILLLPHEVSIHSMLLSLLPQ